MKAILNKQKKYFLFLALSVFSCALLLWGCSGSTGGGGSGIRDGATHVKVNLDIPSTAVASNSAIDSLPFVGTSSAYAGNAPADIGSISIIIVNPDIDMHEYHNVTPGQSVSLNYDNIPVGLTTFEAKAFTGPMGSGAVLYQGQTTVNLEPPSEVVDISLILSIIAEALEALEAGDVPLAHELFSDAVDEYPDDDVANFFYAATSVLVTWFDYESDGVDNGLNTVGDLFDAFDCDPDARDLENMDPGEYIDFYCPEIIPETAPDIPEIDVFIHSIKGQIADALEKIEVVSEDFSISWIEPFDNTQVESDYGDALLLKALLKYFMANLMIYEAYDHDVDIDNDIEAMTNEQFFDRNPGVPVLVAPANLADAKTHLSGALAALRDGILEIGSEVDLQIDDLITLDAVQINAALDDITNAEACLAGPCITDDNNTADSGDDSRMDLSRYFAGNVLIGELLPDFIGDDPTGFLPDPTFNNALIQIQGVTPDELDTDLSRTGSAGKGTADSLERNMYFVYGGNTVPPVPDPRNIDDPESFGYDFLGAANGADGIQDFSGSYLYYIVKPGHRVQVFDFIDYFVYIDAFEFLGTGEYCCDHTFTGSFPFPDPLDILFWSVPWWVFGPPDGQIDELYGDRTHIFMEAPSSTTGLRVFGTVSP